MSDQDLKIRINPKFKLDQYTKAKKIQENSHVHVPDEPKQPNEEVDMELFSGNGPLKEKKEKITKLVNTMIDD